MVVPHRLLPLLLWQLPLPQLALPMLRLRLLLLRLLVLQLLEGPAAGTGVTTGSGGRHGNSAVLHLAGARPGSATVLWLAGAVPGTGIATGSCTSVVPQGPGVPMRDVPGTCPLSQPWLGGHELEELAAMSSWGVLELIVDAWPVAAVAMVAPSGPALAGVAAGP